MPKIILNGCLGKLGRAICLSAQNSDNEIVAGIDINIDALYNAPYPTFNKISECDVAADVIIDCSVASIVPVVLDYAVKKNMPIVVCTTGLSKETNELIVDTSEKIPVFKSANMSLGINLLVNLLERAAKLLDDSGFDIEIIEKHHNLKKDAPSGTALMIADAINKKLDNKFEYRFDRSQLDEPRGKKEIGFQALRGGTIVGEHSIVFAGHDEVIEFTHQAQSKELFAAGALKAARYIVGKGSGLYDMQNIMNEL